MGKMVNAIFERSPHRKCKIQKVHQLWKNPKTIKNDTLKINRKRHFERGENRWFGAGPRTAFCPFKNGSITPIMGGSIKAIINKR